MMSAYLASLLSLSVAQVPMISAELPAGPLLPVKVDLTSRVGLVADGAGYQVVWVDGRRSLGVFGAMARNDVWAARWPPTNGLPSRNVLVARSDVGGGFHNPVVASANGKTFTVFEGPTQGLRLESVGPQAAFPGQGMDLMRTALPASTAFAGADGGYLLAWQSPGVTTFIDVAMVIPDGGISLFPSATNVGSTVGMPPLAVTGNGGMVLATAWRSMTNSPFAVAQNLPAFSSWNSGSSEELFALAGHPTNTVLLTAVASGVRSTPQASTAFTYSLPIYGPGYAVWMGSRVVTLMEVAPNTWSTLNFDPTFSVGIVNGYPVDPGLRPVAFASALGQSGVVAELDTMGGSLRLEDVTINQGNTVTAGMSAGVSLSAAPQRRPTVVWSDDDAAFLVLWDQSERTYWLPFAARLSVTGQFSAPFLTTGTVGGVGIEPRAYRNSSHLAVLVGDQGGMTAPGLLPLNSSDAGVSISAGFLLRPNFNPTYASYGEQSVMGWPDSQQTIDVSFNDSSPTRLGDGPSPRCAAVVEGAHWLTTVDQMGRLVVVRVADQGTLSTSSMVLGNLAGTRTDSTCTTRFVAEDGSTQLATVHASGSAGLAVTRFSPNPLRLLDTIDLGITGAVQPLIVPITEGLLVAWVVPGTNELTGRLVTPGGQVVALMLGPAAIDRRNLWVAPSPEGQAALVWQEFDLAPDRAAVQVHALLVGTRATRPPRDAGVPDAGDVDAGVADAGVPDAGAGDAGLVSVPDAGDPALVSFVPGCGCHSFGGLAPALALLMLLAMRRRGEG
jgi:hypothetical protein